jgi:hypothetical protein
MCAVEGANPPSAAYSALTASSQLQHLSISECTLPTGVWQHVFPAGRHLPHLQSLNISYVKQATDYGYAAAPEGSRLVSCCPGLQSLDMGLLQYNAEGLLQLIQLLHITKLTFTEDNNTAKVLQVKVSHVLHALQCLVGLHV